MSGGEFCGKVGWFSPTDFQALKLECWLDSGHDTPLTHETLVKDLPTDTPVLIRWSEDLPRIEPK